MRTKITQYGGRKHSRKANGKRATEEPKPTAKQRIKTEKKKGREKARGKEERRRK